MASNNVAQFAAELKMPSGVLLEQLQAAGVQKQSDDDTLSETDKAQLLEHLRRSHGTEDADKRKITLTRRQTSEIKQSDGTGRARTIQVEVRKKRVFVKRDEGTPESVRPEAELDQAELTRREEEARREAALLEEKARELRERQEQLAREETERRSREDAAEAERLRAEAEAAQRVTEQKKQTATAEPAQAAEADSEV